MFSLLFEDNMKSGGDQNPECLVNAVRSGHLENTQKYIELLPRVNGCDLLCDAIKFNHLRIVELLLKNGVSPSSPENKSRIPLFCAVESNSTQMVEVLLTAGANISAQNEEGVTPLHLTIFKGNEIIFNLLLRKGADVLMKDSLDKPCIHTAMESSSLNFGIISKLLQYGADVNCKHSGSSLLHVAACRGNAPLVWWLLAQGAFVNDVRSDGFTALHIAVENGEKQITEILLNHQADINCIDYTSPKSCTPLHLAIGRGHYSIARLLVDRGAKIDIPDSLGETVLMMASKTGRNDIVPLVLNQRPNNDDKVFAESVQKNYFEVVQQLLKTGYPVNKLSENKYCLGSAVTPLQHAVERECDEKMIKLLLCHGADINIDCLFGTPRKIAVDKMKPRLLRLLLKYGSDSQKDPSVMILSAGLGDLELLEFLLSNNEYDVNAVKLPEEGKSNSSMYYSIPPGCMARVLTLPKIEEVHSGELSGGTALHMAVAEGHEDAVKMLLEYGAEVNCKTDEDFSPLRVAAGRRRMAIFEILLRFGAKIYKDSLSSEHHLGYIFNDDSAEVLHAFLAHTFANFTALKKQVLHSLLKRVDEENGQMKNGRKLTKDIVLSHVARLKAAGLLFGGEDFVPQKYRDEIANGDFLRSCEAEIGNLKTEWFDEGVVTVYDVLTADDKQLARHARNSAAVARILNSDGFERRYPIYASYVKIRLQKRDVRSECGGRVLETYRLKPNPFSRMPVEVVEYILSYLRSQDLRIFMNIFKPVNPTSQ